MNFNLPTNVQLEVMSYDFTRKKLAKQQAEQERQVNKRKTYPQGKPSRLLPPDVCTDQQWEDIVEHINSRTVEQGKVYVLSRATTDGIETQAVVYHLKQMWVAAWLPRRKDDGYFYGLTYTYKNTAAAHKQTDVRQIEKPGHINSAMYDAREAGHQIPYIKDGRSWWYRKTLIFDQDMIDEGWSDNYWRKVTLCNHDVRSGSKNTMIHQSLRNFDKQIYDSVPQFTGYIHNSYFQRMQKDCNTFEYMMTQYHTRPSFIDHSDNYQHDLDWLINKITNKYRLRSVKDTNWFRSIVSKTMVETKAIWDAGMQEHAFKTEILVKPYARLDEYCRGLHHMLTIYPHINHDLLRTRQELLTHCRLGGFHSETGLSWMRQYLPEESLLNMLQVKWDKYEAEYADDADRMYRSHLDDRTELLHMNMHEYFDTYSMLCQCIQGQLPTESLKPKRWRLTEWHDHLMAETWKINNPNVKLPQKLFPQPVQIRKYVDLTWHDSEHVTPDEGLECDQKITFFQPADTHQLAAWGRAVRNCISSSSHYADGIKKFRHIILLCMVDNKPRYTVQLNVNNGVLDVEQIADIANSRLDPEERQDVEDALGIALRIREQQLLSK